jgi:protein-tyrosine phosphatase
VGQRPLDPPLLIDWLDTADLRDGRPGHLGLTILPGKRGASLRYPGRVYRRDLAADLATLRAAGTALLVLLVEDDELARWGDPTITARAGEAGISVDRRPLADGTAPRSATDMDDLLARIARGRDDGHVAVACMGGVGRAGTVAACALVSAGWSADAAIARVRVVRHPTAVETTEQIGFVQSYERHVATRERKGRVAP